MSGISLLKLHTLTVVILGSDVEIPLLKKSALV